MLADLVGREDVREAVVLSTCNRTEVYASVERFHPGVGQLRDALSALAFAAPEELTDHVYTYHDTAAVAHLFTVAAGLDSALLGESEILGQVRRAWEVAADEGASGPILGQLFRHAGVEALDRGVHLGAVARRQDDGLAHVLPPDEVGQHLGEAFGGDRRPLEELERGTAVVEPEDDERHPEP